MKTLDESFDAFEKYLDSLSDEKLDSMLSSIDALGIEGPSVQEYLDGLTESIGSFYIEPLETATIEQVAIVFGDNIISAGTYDVGTWCLGCKSVVNEFENTSQFENAGEDTYPMAA